MTVTQKIILIAALSLGALCLIVGFTLSHYIGGFLHHVEHEAREAEEAEEGDRQKAEGEAPARETPKE